MRLHNKILIGLVLGAAAGVTANLTLGRAADGFVTSVAEPVGRVWLNALIMVVIPLVVSTLAVGVAGLGDLRRLGRIGGLTLVCFLTLTTMSAALGLAMVGLVRPGDGLAPEVTRRLLETYRSTADRAFGLASSSFGVDTFVNIVPRNPLAAAVNGDMLAVIFFAIMLGAAVTLVGDRGKPLLTLLDSLGHVVVAVIGIVMKAAPIGVFALIFSVTARFGFDIMKSLAAYVVTVLVGLALFHVVVYSLAVRFVAGRNPLEFFRKTRIVMLTAFSTSSSNATLPTTLRITRDELGVQPEIAGFVVPLGATLNMNGTALFEGVTVLFIAQVFGMHLSIGAQVVVIVMSVVTAIGTAGVPGGSIPLLMMVLGMVGVPIEGIAIVLGVDRLLDMCRTVLNVTGDMVTALVVDRFEHQPGREASPV